MGVSPKLALPLRSSYIIPASQPHTLEDGEGAGVEGGVQTQLTVSPLSSLVPAIEGRAGLLSLYKFDIFVDVTVLSLSVVAFSRDVRSAVAQQ